MARVEFDDLSICVDCVMAIANGELPEDEARALEVEEGIKKFEKENNGFLAAGMEELGFAHSSCDVCLSSLGGDRYQAVFLSESD